MGTSVRYTGPEGQANHEVGRATGEGDLLEPGKVYDLPAELAERLVGREEELDDDGNVVTPGTIGSAGWERVANFDDLTDAQIKQLATERKIDGRSKMSRAQLIEALRAKGA